MEFSQHKLKEGEVVQWLKCKLFKRYLITDTTHTYFTMCSAQLSNLMQYQPTKL